MKRNEKLVDQMLDAAERLFVRNGDRGMTVRPLATEATTTSQTIYTYFGNRETVVQQMHDRAVAAVLVDWVPAQATRLRTLRDGDEALPGVIGAFLELLAAHPVLRRFLIDGHGPRDIGEPTMLDVDDHLVRLTVGDCVLKITAVVDMALAVDGRPDGEDAARLLIAQLVGVAAALDTGFAKIGDHQQIADLILGGEVLA